MKDPILIFLSIIVFMTEIANAQISGSVLHLTDKIQPELINDSIHVYSIRDTLTVSDILEKINADQINKYPQQLKGLPDDKENTFWLLFQLENDLETDYEYLINLAFTRTDVVSLYELNSDRTDGILLHKTGDIYKFEKRPIDYRSFVMPVKFEANERKAFLLNLDKRKTVDRFPIRILTRTTLDQLRNRENIRYGLFFGFLLTIFLTSFIASTILRKSVFVLYGGYALFIGLYLFASLGLLFEYVTSDLPVFNYYDLVLFGSWAMVFFSFYSIHFFKPYSRNIILEKVQKMITILLIIMVNGSFLLSISGIPLLQQWMLERYEFVLFSNYLLILLIFIMTIVKTSFLIRKSGILGVMFLAGIFSSLTGITYTVMVDNGMIVDFIFNDNSLATLTGFLLEITFFSVAMVTIARKSLAKLGTKSDALKMKEIHHRMKNNLQTISSMMGLEAMQLTDESAKKIIESGRDRMNAMSKIHQNLYLGDNSDNVDISNYLPELINDVKILYDPEDAVVIDMDVAPHLLNVEKVVALGMITNELTINAFKHAFKDVKSPKLFVQFQKNDANYTLIVNDNGPGLSDLQVKKNSFGMKMIGLLSKQLKGTPNFETSNGLKFSLTLPS